MAQLLSKAGFQVSVKSPEGECKCKSKTRKCLENLSHTYLTYVTPSQVNFSRYFTSEPNSITGRISLSAENPVIWYCFHVSSLSIC
jgi:hypothetical protein